MEVERESVKICVFGDLITDQSEYRRIGEGEEVVHGVDEREVCGVV